MTAREGYYGRPVLKQPPWTPAIPVYFFAGGLAGLSAGLVALARLTGNPILARRALMAGMAGLALAPPLLIADLGRPMRFLNMLRVVKPTSPMSVGTWVLSAFGSAMACAAAGEVLGGPLRRVGRVAEWVAAVLGLPLATYTAVLLSNTSMPAWHEARHELPFVFVGSAAASAGGAAAILVPPRHAGPARRLAMFGAALELAAVSVMERRLGGLAEDYRRGPAAVTGPAAKAMTAAGAALMALLGRRRAGAILAGGLLLAGSLAERFTVVSSGHESARASVGERTVKGSPER